MTYFSTNLPHVEHIIFYYRERWHIIYTKDFDISDEELELNIYEQFFK